MRKIRRFAATILSLCMVFTGAMTAFAAEAESQPEEPVLAAGSARSFILPDYENSSRSVKGYNVHLRAEPGYDGMIIGWLNQGDGLYLSGEAEIVDGTVWLRVLQSIHGAGWIAQQHVQ